MAYVTSTYFNGRMTAKDMKSAYRKLALQFHPDVNNNPNATDTMKLINAEFAYWYARAATEEVKNEKVDNNPKAQDYYKKTYDSAFVANLEEAISWLLSNAIYTRDDLVVEIVGVFIWISGDALRNEVNTREMLKASNFRFSYDKRAWFFTPTSTVGYHATGKSLDQIRSKYGSEKINGYKGQLS